MLAVTAVHNESVLLCELDQFANNFNGKGGIGLCTPKSRIFSPERKQTKAVELCLCLINIRPAVKFLHSKVRRFAQLSAQTLSSLPEQVWVPETNIVLRVLSVTIVSFCYS